MRAFLSTFRSFLQKRPKKARLSPSLDGVMVSSAFLQTAGSRETATTAAILGGLCIGTAVDSYCGHSSMARYRTTTTLWIALWPLTGWVAASTAALPRVATQAEGWTIQHVVVGAAADAAQLAAAPETLVYSNTLGQTAVGYGPGAPIADDLITIGSDGCVLSGYEFQVNGNSEGEGSGPFGVDFALYDGCPHDGGTIISGTEGHADLPTAGEYEIVFQASADADIPIPSTVWLQVVFDREHAGWVGGAPALVGYSDDVFDHPQLSCIFYFGGFPGGPHASFNARLYVRGDCPETYLSYHSSAPRRGTFNPGENVRMADDIELSVNGCPMAAYEVTVRGSAVFDVDLRVADGGPTGLPGAAISGTERTITQASGGLTTARVTFDPPIAIPRQMWFTITASTSIGRTAITGLPPRIGNSKVPYAVFDGTSWSFKDFSEPFTNGALDVSIFCAGRAPMGACCDMFLLDPAGEAVCREVPQANCPYPPPGTDLLPAWREGGACGLDAFDPPCGTAACCLADGSCGNYTEKQCAPGGVSWNRGKFCDSPGVACEYVCVLSDQPCSLPHPSAGCINPFCCAAVCVQPDGAFCCQFEWDDACVSSAAQFCNIPPINDECVGPQAGEGARLVDVPSSTESDGIHATENPVDPGFCCHGVSPGAKGVGTVWYRFVATASSARISTCRSNAPALDSLIQVFEVGDGSTEQTACASLQGIGCSDDVAGCGSSGKNSRICLRNLVPGRMYYVMAAAKTEATRGLYRLQIESPCSEAPPTPCGCPAGQVRWIDPLSGVVDARRPNSPTDAAALEGINQLTVEAPVGADRADCWKLCETRSAGAPNAVAQVNPPASPLGKGGGFSVSGTFAITLNRPITPGAATTITYNGDPTTTGTFLSHPANVNGDSTAAPVDLLDLIDALNGVSALPWGLYSGDIDRSGLTAPADILEAIDLLNGAGAYEVWNGTTRPDPAACRQSE